MPAFLEPTSPAELPSPSAPPVISEVIVEAWLRTVSRREGAKFLQNLAVVLGDREEMASVVPIRRTEKGIAAARAEREALAVLRQMLPVLLANLPPG